MKNLLAACGLFLIAGCAGNQMVVKPAFDFSKVKRITVLPFPGPGGPAITDEFVRQLLATGIEVTDASHPGDVILSGTVTDYNPKTQLMVFLGGDNPIVAPSAQMTPEEATIGAHKAQMASMVASVGIQAHLTDKSSRQIVWGDSYSYEALDLPTALVPAVAGLTVSLKRTLPAMNKKP